MGERDLQNAILLVDKPSGLTSFETISTVKRILKLRKVGHSGTLDKFASGLLVVCTGWCTKLTRFFLDSDKRYDGSIRLGISTDTDDREGTVLSRNTVVPVRPEDIEYLTGKFSGVITQKPPRYSALKIQGKRASDRVRSGEKVEIAEREVSVYSLVLERAEEDAEVLNVHVHCSKGTYVRSLARDIGETLGFGGHLEELRRVGSGRFSVDDAATLDEIQGYAAGRCVERDFIRDPVDAFSEFGSMVVDATAAERIMNGAPFKRDNVLQRVSVDNKPYLILNEKKNLIAIVDADIENWRITYINVFNVVYK